MKQLFYCLAFLVIAGCSSAQSYEVGTRVKLKWSDNWYEGTIVELGDKQYKVDLDNLGAEYTQWHTKDKLVLLKANTQTKNKPVQGQANQEPTTPVKGLTGKLYLRTSFFGTSLSISTIFLSSNGVIVRDAKNGVDPLDIEKEKQLNAYNTGTYTINGDKMNISWSDGKTASWRMEYKNVVLSGLDGGVVTLQSKMPAGYKLNGRFAAAGVTANASSSQTYTFKSDGTFSLKSTGNVDNTEETGTATDNKNGQYTITGNTLFLKFNNGQTTRSVICISTIGDKQHLVINRGSYPQE